MTLTQLQQAVLGALGDGGNTVGFYTPAEAEAALNAAQQVFALGSFCIERTATQVITAGNNYGKLDFADMIVPFTVRVGGIRFEASSLADMQAENPYWTYAADDRARIQRKYAILGSRMIAIAPRSPNDMTLSVLYAAAPVPISGSPEIAAEYHPALAQYAIARLRIKEGGSMMAKDANRMREFWTAVLECGDKVRNRCRTHFYDAKPPVFRVPKEPKEQKAPRNG
jgi:hypothetical protein